VRYRRRTKTHAGGPNKAFRGCRQQGLQPERRVHRAIRSREKILSGGFKGIVEKEGALLLSLAPRGPRLNRKGNLANPNPRQPHLRIAPEGGYRYRHPFQRLTITSGPQTR